MTPLAPDVEEFLKEPNVAALSTVRPDGRPHVTPVWYEYDGREFVISTPRGTQKLANIGRKGYAALAIFTHAMPYRHVIVEGSARGDAVYGGDGGTSLRAGERRLGRGGDSRAAGKVVDAGVYDWVRSESCQMSDSDCEVML